MTLGPWSRYLITQKNEILTRIDEGGISIQVVGFWLLALESRDLSQTEKKVWESIYTRKI